MSHFLDRLKYFSEKREAFAGGPGTVTHEDRSWEEAYRQRWQHDKIVRSTHGVLDSTTYALGRSRCFTSRKEQRKSRSAPRLMAPTLAAKAYISYC